MAKKKKQQKRSNVLWFYSGTDNTNSNVGVIRKRYQGKRGTSPIAILVDFTTINVPVSLSEIEHYCNILCNIIQNPKTASISLLFLEMDRQAVDVFQKSGLTVSVVANSSSFSRLDWINIWNVSNMLYTRLKEYAKVHG